MYWKSCTKWVDQFFPDWATRSTHPPSFCPSSSLHLTFLPFPPPTQQTASEICWSLQFLPTTWFLLFDPSPGSSSPPPQTHFVMKRTLETTVPFNLEFGMPFLELFLFLRGVCCFPLRLKTLPSCTVPCLSTPHCGIYDRLDLIHFRRWITLSQLAVDV